MKQTIKYIENILKDQYSLEFGVSAHDFLMPYSKIYFDKHDLESSQAQLVIEQSQEPKELFVGIYFPESLQKIINLHRPESALTTDNINAFCAIIEEVSHFYLIHFRAAQSRPTSQIELECQGEIDKFLIAAQTLKAQTGKHHFEQLREQLFFNFKWSTDLQYYRHANRSAFNLLELVCGKQGKKIFSLQSKKILREFYRMNWQDKTKFIDSQASDLKNIA